MHVGPSRVDVLFCWLLFPVMAPGLAEGDGPLAARLVLIVNKGLDRYAGYAERLRDEVEILECDQLKVESLPGR